MCSLVARFGREGSSSNKSKSNFFKASTGASGVAAIGEILRGEKRAVAHTKLLLNFLYLGMRSTRAWHSGWHTHKYFYYNSSLGIFFSVLGVTHREIHAGVGEGVKRELARASDDDPKSHLVFSPQEKDLE